MKEQITMFIKELLAENKYALNTSKAYAQDLKAWQSFCQNYAIKSWQNLDEKNINLFIKTLRMKNFSVRTIKRYLSTLSAFFAYLDKKSPIASKCHITRIKVGKTEKLVPKTLTYEQIECMLRMRANGILDLRNIAMISVFYSAGLRLSELVGLNLSDIDRNEGFVRVLAKGGFERYVPVGKETIQYIQRYLHASVYHNLQNLSKQALFLNRIGKRISARMVENIIKECALKSGIDIYLHPHMLRHSSATHFLQSSHDLVSVQNFLGHKSIKSTQCYTHLDYLELAKVYDKCHPRAKH